MIKYSRSFCVCVIVLLSNFFVTFRIKIPKVILLFLLLLLFQAFFLLMHYHGCTSHVTGKITEQLSYNTVVAHNHVINILLLAAGKCVI